MNYIVRFSKMDLIFCVLRFYIINANITNMEQEIEQEQKKPSLKELILGYKDKKISPIKRAFNTTYVVFTLLAYIYYVVYATIHIVKNGLENPISILLLVAVIIYTLILAVCAIMSTSIKTAKKRIKKSLRVFKVFKRSITIISSVVAVVALIATLKADQSSGWTIFVSIMSLIFNFIKISFAIMGIMFTASASALKFGAKQTVKHLRKKAELEKQKKSAPAIETDADDKNITIESN